MPFRSMTRLQCELLESRLTPAAGMPSEPIPWNAFVIGAAPGAEPYATVYNSDGAVFGRIPTMSFDPTGASGVVPFLGGVRAVLGDVTGDATPELVAGAMAGGGPRVQVFDGRTYQLLYDFYAFDPAFAGGVNLAVGFVTADAFGDIVVGAGPGGGPHVKVFDGRDGAEAVSLFAYDAAFRGGVSVAALQRSSAGQIITGAGPGGGPHVKVFGWELEYVPPRAGESFSVARTGRLAEIASYYAFAPEFRGGVNVAAADGLPRMEVFSNSGPVVVHPPVPTVSDVAPFPPDTPLPPPPPPPPVGTRFFYTNGAPVLVAQASGGSQIRYFSPRKDPWTLSPFGDFGGGASVIVRHVAGDLSPDLIVGAGPGGDPRVRVIGGGIRPLLDFYADGPPHLGGVQVG